MRARDLGIPFDGVCGKYNAITDVAGVEVGYKTIIRGEATPDTTTSSDFARTGVTCILPRGKQRSAVFAGRADLNGNGELTGTHWIDDSGFLHGPVMITNTNSVGVVRDAVSKWMVKNHYYWPSYDGNGKTIPGLGFFYPTVAETFDGNLNNINGFGVTEADALEAIENAAPGPVAEGNVGGGTAMRCHGFKGGSGTASRIVKTEAGTFTVGVFVQANYGTREEFCYRGIPFGREIKGCEPEIGSAGPKEGDGSIIVVYATDAPMLPWQLSKLARRATIGIGNLGGGCGNGSGDIFLAFSTANENAFTYTSTQVTLLGDEMLNPIYKAAVQATEEAIFNALVSAEDMVGRNCNKTYALPHDQVKEILKKYHVVAENTK